MKFLKTLFAAFVCLAEATGKQDPAVCGTHRVKNLEELAAHRTAQRQIRTSLRAGAPGLRSNSDIGNIAVISDAGGVVARRNAFNLDGRTLRFTPVTGGYRLEVGGNTYDNDAAGAGTAIVGIDDDDSRRIVLPFQFPFFGVPWGAMHVNSDGNLTFGEGEAGTSERSLGRLHGGPPRIAAMFRDLDPTQPGGAIRVFSDARRAVVSWVGVREYADFGTGVRQTFQIRFYPTGVIDIAYSETRTSSAVVGITPGHGIGTPQFVTLLSAPPGLYDSTVAERFTNNEEIDIFTAAQRFYETHDDAYDYLVLYNSNGVPAGDDALAYQVTIRNQNVSGIGDVPVDLGLESGSPKRLQAILNMGPLSQYPADPNSVVPARAISGDTPLTVLGHEAGHLWLALASIRENSAANSFPLLGRGSSHWSFNFNSEASLLEGNRIEDLGEGATPRFRTVATVEGYSPLDRYLMGLAAPEEVPPMYYVRNASTAGARAPQVGVSINGTRRDFTVDEVIAAEGRRTPDHTVSQRRFRLAFVLVNPEGQAVGDATLQKIEKYRTEFQTFFNRATAGQGEAETALSRSLSISAFPAAGVVQDRTAPVTVRLERRVAFPLYLILRQRFGLLELPFAVVVPPGAAEATFLVRGLRPGVEELRVEPFDRSFESVTAKVQIALPGDTRLTVLEPEELAPRVIRVRLTDINLLPYPGVRVTSDIGSALTGADGVASFIYTGAAGAELRFRAETGATVILTVPE